MKMVIGLVLCVMAALPILMGGCSSWDAAAAAPPAVTVLPVQPSPIPEDEAAVPTSSPIQIAPESKSVPPSPTPTKTSAKEKERRGLWDFMWIEGIPGDSTYEGHEGWIQVLRYDIRVGGVVAPYTIGNEAPTFSKFTIVKSVDRASPLLIQAACQGTRIPQVVIELCRGTTESQETYMRYRLTDVLITKVTERASPQLMGGNTLPMEDVSLFGGDTLPMEDISLLGGETLPIEEVSAPLPMEQVSLVYRTIEWTYFTLEGEAISAGWNLAENSTL